MVSSDYRIIALAKEPWSIPGSWSNGSGSVPESDAVIFQGADQSRFQPLELTGLSTGIRHGAVGAIGAVDTTSEG